MDIKGYVLGSRSHTCSVCVQYTELTFIPDQERKHKRIHKGQVLGSRSHMCSVCGETVLKKNKENNMY